MKPFLDYVRAVASHFHSQLGSSLVEAYQLGSLAHGGFSSIYSDIDVALVLSCAAPPAGIERWIADAKKLHPEYGKKLSVFWGNPEFGWGRLPVLDRLDLLDHGLPLMRNCKAEFPRPTRDEIENALLESVEKSWKPRVFNELNYLRELEPAQRKPYIRAVLYPARLIYSWDFLAVDSNDRAVDYLLKIKPEGLNLEPIVLALECRHGRCSVEDVFALQADLGKQFDSTMEYIAKARNSNP
jgi:predicted nucleotidyltransferase